MVYALFFSIFIYNVSENLVDKFPENVAFFINGIGNACDALLRQMGVETYTVNRSKPYPIPVGDTLEELCATCDLLILSLPKTDNTDNLFDERMLKLLKGKYIVNVGRSNAIDEKALYEALASGSLKGAAIYTWRQKARSAD